MSWDPRAPQGFEHRKIRWEIVPWTRGKGLDLGAGMEKAYPHFIGVDNGHHEMFRQRIQPDIRANAEDLAIFADGSMDFCFSSHLLEHYPYEEVPKVLAEWMRVIKPGGYLVLYLPDEDQYPNVGEPEANPDHKWNVNQAKVLEAMPDGFDLIDYQVRDKEDEYSLYFVFKKAPEGRAQSYRTKKRPAKTAGVIRYGAFGDLMQASSVLAGLKKQGYHVTLFSSPPGCDVIRHDPNIDVHFLQDKDQVPNPALGEYWGYWKKRFDKWVNLSESVEGSFLALPGRVQHEWPPDVRHRHMNVNYLQHQHEIAGVPDVLNMRFYATPEEREWAKAERAKMGKTAVLWQLAGSSRMHKTYPWLDEIVARLMISYPDVEVVLTGGPECRMLEDGWQEEKRVHCTSGLWTIRQTLAFLEEADVIVGAETGVLNAAACLAAPKIVFLSHSTRNNLTRDWVNTVALSSPHTHCPGRGENAAPACHMMHYTFEFCRKGDKKGVAACMEDIHPALVWEALQDAIITKKARKPKLAVVAA
jgi:ADP-heptose:LPS heptosyltransferase/predicted SAM-dependent methyltransferase